MSAMITRSIRVTEERVARFEAVCGGTVPLVPSTRRVADGEQRLGAPMLRRRGEVAR